MLRATTACTFSCLIWPAGSALSEPTFRPSGATNHWKNTVNRDSPIFSRIYLFFLLILSLLTLLTSAFQLSILSEVSLLNFLRSALATITVSSGEKLPYCRDSRRAEQRSTAQQSREEYSTVEKRGAKEGRVYLEKVK